LYGTTELGGAFGGGAVYKLDASGKFAILYSFTGPDGINLWAGVIIDRAGTLYGTAAQGGAFNHGTVDKLEARGQFTVLHTFPDSDGSTAAGDPGQRGHALWHHDPGGSIWARYSVQAGGQREVHCPPRLYRL